MVDEPWSELYARLLDPESDLSPQKRGLQFETVLWRLFKDEGLEPRKSYRTLGEQIDGSFLMDGRTYLLEAKWTSSGIPASTLYEFRGKVDGKLVGTIGVFISIGGYSPDAVNTLIAGKTLNLVLFNGDDMNQVFSGETSFREALALKLRAAAEQGTPLNPLAEGLTETQPVEATAEPGAVEQRRIIVVEGQSDIWLLSALLRSAAEDFSDIQFLVAFGRLNVPRIAAVFSGQFEGIVTDVVLVVDGDGRSAKEVQDELARMTPDSNVDLSSSLIVFEPEIEDVFGVSREWRREYMKRGESALPTEAHMWRRVEESPSLRQFVDRLGATRAP